MGNALQPFLDDPGSAGIFSDFDGSLSEIVTDPSAARPVEGTAEVLSELAERFRTVAIVSGRSAAQLLEWLGGDIEIWGVHGAERAVAGEVILSDDAAPYEPLMRRVLQEAAERIRALNIEGATIEDKRVVVNLHYRAARDRSRAAAALKDVATELARSHDLIVGTGRLTYEMKPPIRLSKEAVVLNRSRAMDLRAVMFLGDDAVDLPAFDALDELASEGRTACRVAVASDEAPAELLDRADEIVDGPVGAVRLLRALL